MSSARALDSHYRALQDGFSVRRNVDYGTLVVPNGNGSAPVHRWFRLKEAFSSDLFMRVLKDTDLQRRDGLRILDPFSGVGTTAVSVIDAVASGELTAPVVHGVESNPFLHLVGSTKIAALRRAPRGFLDLARKLAASALRETDLGPPKVPQLSTFRREGSFDPIQLERLLKLRDAIQAEQQAGCDPLLVDLARVCLGAIVEPVSNLRRDGRALRHVENKVRVGAVEAFLAKAEEIDADLPTRPVKLRARTWRGDGRSLSVVDRRERDYDLVLFSPPYPNNIDYTEVYKLEAWLLGLVTDAAGFSAQRLRTVYSHPSLLRPDPLPSPGLSEKENEALASLIRPLEEAIPADRYAEGRRRMIRGYTVDMYRTLRSSTDRMREGSSLVYVVGNSVHGRAPKDFVIAADLLIAALAEMAGLKVATIDIARWLRRRSVSSPYLRESVVYLRKEA